MALARLIHQILVKLHEINDGVKTAIVRNVECDRIFDFMIELLPRLLTVEAKQQNENTLVEGDSIVTRTLMTLSNATTSKSTVVSYHFLLEV